jgi:hypothetical protein
LKKAEKLRETIPLAGTIINRTFVKMGLGEKRKVFKFTLKVNLKRFILT